MVYEEHIYKYLTLIKVYIANNLYQLILYMS